MKKQKDDLIDRQAAIKALGKRPNLWTGGDYELGCANQYDLDKLAIETVPSAQPEQSTGVQDILQYLDKYLHPIVSPEHWSVYSELYDMVSMLPSAQPEIIRCNSCKYWTQSTGEMNGYGLGRCDFHDADLVTCNGFCYWAERRNNECTN